MASVESHFATRTTTKLLDALHDRGNEPAWVHLDARYRPVLCGLARRLGLNQEGAEEVAQQALAEFVKAYRENRYDRSRGRLSSWILSIARNITLHLLRDSKRGPKSGTPLPDVPDDCALRTIWTDERDRTILDKALAMMRDDSGTDDRTLRAFELVALRGVPAAQAGEQCSMSVDQVYVARSRVTKRLRVLVDELTAAFEEDT